MILLMLGTQDKPFTRALDMVETAIKNGTIKEKVIAQIGHTKYKSKDIELRDWIDKVEISKLMEECTLLIAHGGVGTIIDGLNHKKPVIVIPRLKKYGEHTNDHQLQITSFCEQEGYCLACYDDTNIETLLKKAKKFIPKEYKSNTNSFIKTIEEAIESVI